jgi:hypothetical protein
MLYAMGLAIFMPTANAGQDYCHYTESGSYMCINSVWGPRASRGINASVDGRIFNMRVNCFNRNYEPTSIIAVACWAYEGIQNVPKNPKYSDDQKLQKLLTGGGFVKPSSAIDIDKVIRNSIITR